MIGFYKRGDIYEVALGRENIRGSEQRGTRPAVIISCDEGNQAKNNTTLIVAFLTDGRIHKHSHMPTQAKLEVEGLEKPSVFLGEQIRTIDICRLRERKGYLSEEQMTKIDKCLKIALGLN